MDIRSGGPIFKKQQVTTETLRIQVGQFTSGTFKTSSGLDTPHKRTRWKGPTGEKSNDRAVHRYRSRNWTELHLEVNDLRRVTIVTKSTRYSLPIVHHAGERDKDAEPVI